MSARHEDLGSSDFIGELCIALRHRWRPDELLVIFTSYFDEADTHGPDPTVIMASFLGHAFQWRRFETKLAKLRKKHGFNVFHAKDFKAGAKEFSGWKADQSLALVYDLTDMVEKTLTEGFAISLERERYLKEYRAPPIPKKMNLDSQYGVCFRACMAHLFEFLAARGNQDRLNVVIEGGHHNVNDCWRIFDDLKRRHERLGAHILGTFSVERKESCPPLMVADYLAASYSMMRADISFDELEDKAAPPHREKAHLTYLELKPDALDSLKKGFERLRQLEIDEWRAARDARRLSCSSMAPQPS